MDFNVLFPLLATVLLVSKQRTRSLYLDLCLFNKCVSKSISYLILFLCLLLPFSTFASVSQFAILIDFFFGCCCWLLTFFFTFHFQIKNKTRKKKKKLNDRGINSKRCSQQLVSSNTMTGNYWFDFHSFKQQSKRSQWTHSEIWNTNWYVQMFDLTCYLAREKENVCNILSIHISCSTPYHWTGWCL